MWLAERGSPSLARLYTEWWAAVFAPVGNADFSVEGVEVELSFAPALELERRIRTSWEPERPAIIDALARGRELPRFYSALARILRDDEVLRGMETRLGDRDLEEPVWLGSSIRVGPLPASLTVDPRRWPLAPGAPGRPVSLERPVVPPGAVELVLGVVLPNPAVGYPLYGPMAEPFRLPAGFVEVGWDVANAGLYGPEEGDLPEAPVRVRGCSRVSARRRSSAPTPTGRIRVTGRSTPTSWRFLRTSWQRGECRVDGPATDG